MEMTAMRQLELPNIRLYSDINTKKKSGANHGGVTLSTEQQKFINEALKGKNILVDACIGSGKTTAIQHLCNEIPSAKRVLYLTYNKLLKLDAKSKIKNKNVVVSNYHGYAYSCLARARISVGISDIIQAFIKHNPPIGKFDVLIIDEYQDIEQELATMLVMIKEANPGIQIVAVGDMMQKVYDKTTLNVEEFIDEFIDNRISLEFTQCFRLSSEHAAMLGRVWNKKIVGVNPSCEVKIMRKYEAVEFLGKQNPSDVLCLGARYGDLSETLNLLEYKYPDKYNKNTVYASIRDDDAARIEPKPDTGIFTTFDSSKGLEKDICMVFDYTEDYWFMRTKKPQVKYDIIRNIFCVAASRGKKQIIFVQGDTQILSERTLCTPTSESQNFEDMNISEMFDFKYKEDVEKCYEMLKIKKIINEDNSVIDIKTTDGFIDLSPCIGTYLEASYFDGYSLLKDMELLYDVDKDLSPMYKKEFMKRNMDMQGQTLAVTAAATHLTRYLNQVKTPFIDDSGVKAMHARLKTMFEPGEQVQVSCGIEINYMDGGKERSFAFKGFSDVVKDEIIYELKFVSELRHEHFLQCACYMISTGIKKGVLWNVKDNKMYEIQVADAEAFLLQVVKTITKGYLYATSEQEGLAKPKKKRKTSRKNNE